MKRMLMATVLCLVATTLTTAQDHLDEITHQTCECINNMDSGLSAQEAQMRMGMCILEAAMPYQEQLKTYEGIDLSNQATLPQEAHRLGELIGQRMATECPGAMAKVFSSLDEGAAPMDTTTRDYLDEIANEACACIDKLDSGLSTHEAQMRMGMCFFEAAMPYQEQLKADHGIDLSNEASLSQEGRSLGELIGQRMALKCPSTIAKIFSSTDEESAPTDDDVAPSADDAADTQVFEGTVSEVTQDHFVIFSVRNDAGKRMKFYWLTPVEANFDLVGEYAGLNGQRVRIAWTEIEVFDPRLEEYRKIAVILSIEKL